MTVPCSLVPPSPVGDRARTNGAPVSERDTADLVHADIADAVATITLDSPTNRNALSSRLVDDLNRALDRAESAVAEGAVRAIVLTHVPPAFCAGADLKERSTTGVPDSRPIVRAFTRLMDAEVPTIAAVKGPVRAGGIGLMASCDLVVVQRDVGFALTEVRIGVAAAIISVPILRRASGSRLAAAFLTGEPFSSEEARSVGLVTHVTDDVDATVAALCGGIRQGAPAAVRATKRLLREVPGMPREEAFERMRALSDELFRSPEAAEGMAAFREKRTPRWTVE
jgi:methylglutaconyl-CoA hydratase